MTKPLALLAATLLTGCATPPLPEVSGWSPGYDEGSSLSTAAEVRQAFSALDDDDDGAITRFEAVEWPELTAQFHRGDADGSESIDRAEFERLLDISDFGRL